MAQKDQFTTHYEKDGFRVFTNSSGDIFLEQGHGSVDHGGVTIRFSRHPIQGIRFTTGAMVEPEIVGNMVGYRVHHRR